MKDGHLTQCGDTDKISLMIDVGTKEWDKAETKGEQIVEDLLSACSFTRREMKDNPKFKKALEKIEKKLWKCLK